MKTQGKVWLFYDAEKKVQTKPMSVVQAQVFLLSLKKSDHLKYFVWTPGWPDWTSIKEFLKSGQNYFVMTKPPKPNGKTVTNIKVPKVDDATAVIESSELTKTKTKTHVTKSGIFTRVKDGEAIKKATTTVEYGYYAHDFNGDDLDLSKINKVAPPDKVKIYEDSLSISRNEDADRRKEARHAFKIEVILVAKTKTFRTYSKDISLSGTQLENSIPREFLNMPFDLIIVNPYEKNKAQGRLLFRAKIIGDMTDPRRLMFIEQDVEMTKKLDFLLKSYTQAQARDKKAAG